MVRLYYTFRLCIFRDYDWFEPVQGEGDIFEVTIRDKDDIGSV